MFRFGMDYYPEHWPQERWAKDAQLMQAAGVNAVRLAEFAWSFLETGPDHFDFVWLDRAIKIFSQHDIQVVIGTPTGSPPPWLMAMFPDAFRVKITRRRAVYGGRRDYCPSHTGFRDRCKRVVTALAKHYAENPAVIGWQTDNEFSRLCFCENCQSRFQAWLEDKYGSLKVLNQTWGTAFWSHNYTHWSQIPLPEDDGGDPSYNYGPNPALYLNFRRFTSDTIVDFQQEQIDLLRRYCPDHFITHNTGFGFEDLNFFDITRPLDFVSLDFYPRNPDQFVSTPDPSEAARFLDQARSLKNKNFWMTEQQAGQGGMKTLSTLPRPGELRLWTYQSIAHGADAIIYFRWRTALFGAEQFWHGVLDHHGEPRARYYEIAEVGAELKRIGHRFKDASYKAKTAIICSWDSMYAFQNQPNHPDFDYLAHLSSFHKALNKHNIQVDIISPDADLRKYQLVIAPALFVLGPDLAERLKEFVQNGGYLLLSARSGIKDLNNNVIEAVAPGLLAEVCGTEIECYEPLPLEHHVPIMLNLDGDDSPATFSEAWMWCDVLTPTSARAVAQYTTEFYAGRAAATLNHYGQGQVLYLGTFGKESLHDTVLEWLTEAAGITPVFHTPAGVEATERWKNDQPILFILNHADEIKVLSLPRKYHELISGKDLQGEVHIDPKAVLVLKPINKG